MGGGLTLVATHIATLGPGRGPAPARSPAAGAIQSDSASHSEGRSSETVSQDLRRFAEAHQAHGEVEANADAIESDAGYRLWAACECGATWERWVTPEEATEDLIRSDLLANDN